MRKLFKNFNILGLVAFIAGGIFAISWTVVKKSESANLFYSVTLKPGGDADNLEDYEIDPNGVSTPTGDCNKTSGILCAIEMNLNGTPVPNTVADAEENDLIESSVYRDSQ